MISYDYIYAWGNNTKRKTMKGRRCRVLARGRKNSIMIEFENGQREIVSRNSIKKAPAHYCTKKKAQMKLWYVPCRYCGKILA